MKVVFHHLGILIHLKGVNISTFFFTKVGSLKDYYMYILLEQPVHIHIYLDNIFKTCKLSS